MFKRTFSTLLIILFISNYNSFANNLYDKQDWREEEGIYTRIYDAKIKLISGEQTSIHQLAAKKPLIVALVFTRCAGVCNPLLLQLKENIQIILRKNQYKFSVLVLSFDPLDSLKDMQNLAYRFNLLNEPNWELAVVDSISSMTKSVNFFPVWDMRKKQYDHDALLVGVNTQGYITKKLIGLRSADEISLLISDINNVYSPSYRLPTPANMFTCFNYDPKTGKNTPGWGLAFIALPALLTVGILAFLRFRGKYHS